MLLFATFCNRPRLFSPHAFLFRNRKFIFDAVQPYDTAHVCCMHETSGHGVTVPVHAARTRRVRHQTYALCKSCVNRM